MGHKQWQRAGDQGDVGGMVGPTGMQLGAGCVCAPMCAYVCALVCARALACVHVCTQCFVCICMCTGMCTCVCACTGVYVCMCVCVCVVGTEEVESSDKPSEFYSVKAVLSL